MNVLVTGATGYIGGELVPRLLAQGHSVTCMVRSVARAQGRMHPGARLVEGDVLRSETLVPALKNADVAYYLIHSMGEGEEAFETRDRDGAANFAVAAKAAGVQRIIYLGALGNADSRLSPHLKSRQETGNVLRRLGPPVTEFRAAIIVGGGSVSFEIIRHLSERLPVMVCPRWVSTRVQPIAIADVLNYLVEALHQPRCVGEIIDIGGASVETYGSMMLTYARIRGLKRWLLRVPVLTPRLSSYWLDLVTPIPPSVSRPLIEGLRSEVVCRDSKAREIFPAIVPADYEAAVQAVLAAAKPNSSNFTTDLPADGHRLSRVQGFVFDTTQQTIGARAEKVFTLLDGMGGERGWFYADSLWRLRGWIDGWIGGPGMRRGRSPGRTQAGGRVDFWRVEDMVEGRRILLRAESRLPGSAWLEFALTPLPAERCRLRCTSIFQPLGLAGELYWWMLYPIHRFIFRGMVRKIASQAEAPVCPLPLEGV